jgi:hypothetical protein
VDVIVDGEAIKAVGMITARVETIRLTARTITLVMTASEAEAEIVSTATLVGVAEDDLVRLGMTGMVATLTVDEAPAHMDDLGMSRSSIFHEGTVPMYQMCNSSYSLMSIAIS